MNDIKAIVDIEAFSLGMRGAIEQSGIIIPATAVSVLLNQIPSMGLPYEYSIKQSISVLFLAGTLGLY
jgi:hypothetical protein